MNIRPTYTTDEQSRIEFPINHEEEIGDRIRNFRRTLIHTEKDIEVVKFYADYAEKYGQVLASGVTGVALSLLFEMKWSAWREVQARLDPVVED